MTKNSHWRSGCRSAEIWTPSHQKRGHQGSPGWIRSKAKAVGRYRNVRKNRLRRELWLQARARAKTQTAMTSWPIS